MVLYVVQSHLFWVLEVFMLFGMVMLGEDIYKELRYHPELGESDPMRAMRCTLMLVGSTLLLLAVPYVPFALELTWLVYLAAFFYVVYFFVGLFYLAKWISMAWGRMVSR